MSQWLMIFCFPALVMQCTHGHRGPSQIPISVTPPNFPGGFSSVNATAIPGPFLRDFQPPLPTDSWWAGFTVFDNQRNVAAGPFPFQSKTANDGFEFGIGTARSSDGSELTVPTKLDLSIRIANLPVALDNRKATAWDTQTLSLRYMASDGSTMDTTLVPGSPYMTFRFTNAKPIIRSISGNIGFQWITQGQKGRLTCGGGTYVLYVTSGPLNQFNVNTNTLTFTTTFTGSIRLAKVVDPQQETILDTYASTYATGLTMAYDAQGDIGTTTWTWDVVGDPTKLLIMCWPHHRKVLVSPTYVNIEYLNVKGRMKGVVGNQWIQKFNLPPIRWNATLPPHQSCVSQLMKTLEFEVTYRVNVRIPGEVYRWGSRTAAGATLAIIADTLGRTDLRDKVLSITKQAMEYFFTPGKPIALAYETKWGGVSDPKDDSFKHYNDHHFLYGYFLHIAAIIAKYDPAWLSQHLDFLNHIARDIGNPCPEDKHYTVFRHIDFFTGHSWASGLQGGAGNRNQESSSEAINAYYGLLLFADVSGNTELVKWARLLLAFEIIGAQTYWHLYPKAANPDEPYPEQNFRDLVTVANIYPDGASRFLHWGTHKKIQVAAIQIAPLTPMGELTYDKPWAEQVVPFCSNELNNASESDEWKTYVYAAYAKYNPQLAYKYSSELKLWGDGNSASNQLYFISTKPSPNGANICTNILHTPEGIFTIQDVTSGKYVGISNGKLTANVVSNLIATKFQFSYIPNGGVMKSTTNGLYVGANPEGTNGLVPNKQLADLWETFRWTAVTGGYQLKAMANMGMVYTASGGELSNTATTPGKYRLTATTFTKLPAQGKLQSVQSNMFVVATTSNLPLMAVGLMAQAGTTFRFQQVGDTESYSIWNTATGLAVSGDPSGTVTLKANKPVAYGWERFRAVSVNGQYILVSEASGLAVNVRPDGTLLNNDATAGNVARWRIV